MGPAMSSLREGFSFCLETAKAGSQFSYRGARHLSRASRCTSAHGQPSHPASRSVEPFLAKPHEEPIQPAIHMCRIANPSRADGQVRGEE